jgi:hypothetical protein
MIDATFEAQLSGLLREYAETGVRPIDRFTIAEETIARGRNQGGSRWSFGRARRPLRLVLIGVLIAALAAGVALVGSRLLAPPSLLMPDTYLNELVQRPDLSRPKDFPVVVPLADGRVLVAGTGGDGGDSATTAELYDPATGISVPAGAVSADLRNISSAVRLGDGRVLVFGNPVSRIFDPTTMESVEIGPMVTPRLAPRTALLPDGRVLVVGGYPPPGGYVEDLRSAELFDPDTMTFSATGSMGTSGGLLATLPDGRVFVAPGDQSDAAQVYDPSTGMFSAAGRMSTPFESGSAISLPDGRVVVFASAGIKVHLDTEVWDPISGTFSKADDPPGAVFSATLLGDGRIFLIGGRDPSWAGIYDPATETTSPTAAPKAVWPTVTPLPDGRLLLVGGLLDGKGRIGPAGDVQMAPAVATVQIFQ